MIRLHVAWRDRFLIGYVVIARFIDDVDVDEKQQRYILERTKESIET
jgi:hypothetical protein